ncbi:MAG TPA: hypothetical protein VEK73_14195 [Xanthobacteraceae bacterium]|nr:hypothetical protein [Xanthobacteraceae bacterium]
MNDTLNPPPSPTRVAYATGRMLGVEDFQAEQDYHRGRLARTLLQLYGTGTVTGLLVQTDGNTDATKLEIQVTPGMAIDRVGRVIEVPRMVCIVLNDWLTQYVQAWQSQQRGNAPGTPLVQDPNQAIHDGQNLTVDVFATFVPCTRGLTPCFAAQDDYDATDAFAPNRLLDSFAMQLVLRTDAAPKTPLDPWAGLGAQQPALAALRQSLLAGPLGPSGTPTEYPPNFDQTAVFLARILVPATAGTTGNPPTWNLIGLAANKGSANIDNLSRLFVIPASVVSRWNGLGSGTES